MVLILTDGDGLYIKLYKTVYKSIRSHYPKSRLGRFRGHKPTRRKFVNVCCKLCSAIANSRDKNQTVAKRSVKLVSPLLFYLTDKMDIL